MARIFDNNVANYLSRASVNLGLNGATECSFGFWLQLRGITADQKIVQKEINAQDGWGSIMAQYRTATNQLDFEVENQAGNDFPTWLIAAPGPGVWHRYLFAWARTAGAVQGDAAVYVDGLEVATSFTAQGYTNTFTIQEDSSNLYYGIRPISLTVPLHAGLGWVTVWNRKLTAQEALMDAFDCRHNVAGMLIQTPINPETDRGPNALTMTVNGVLAPAEDPPLGNPPAQSLWPMMVAA